MARTSVDKDSLGAKIKEIEYFITPKMAKKLTFEDAEALSVLANNIQELLSNTLGKLVPSVVSSKKYNSPAYKNTSVTYGSVPSNSVVSINSLNEEQPKIVIASDPLGGNFDSGVASIGLFDITEEVNKQVAESIQTVEGPVEDEVEKLNSIFASVEDVQQ